MLCGIDIILQNIIHIQPEWMNIPHNIIVSPA